MELALPNIPLEFEVTFQAPDLPVAMSVYDLTSGTPVLVDGPTAMINAVANTYTGSFIALNNKTYLIFKAVYTDLSFSELSPDYSQSTETIVVKDIGGGGGSTNDACQVIGLVKNSTLVGVVRSSPNIIGIVEC